MRPETRYAKSGDVYIAYQTVGNAPLDLVFLPSLSYSHVDFIWEEPAIARFLTRLASFSRLILFDRRGAGASDRTALGPLEESVDDLAAVLDAVGSDRTALLGLHDGGQIGTLFAATHPARTSALVVHGVARRATQGPDFPWLWAPDSWQAVRELALHTFGTAGPTTMMVPSVAHDKRIMDWFARAVRFASSPTGLLALMDQTFATDLGAVLPAIQAPTLYLRASRDVIMPKEAALDFVNRVPHARYAEIPGGDAHPFFEYPDAFLDVVQEFLTGVPGARELERVLATVLFVDIVGSTELASKLGDRKWRDLLDSFYAAARKDIERFRGREVKTLGDGMLATFDGPARAIRCGQAMVHDATGLGIDIRVGLHTGEIETAGEDVGGIAVHIGARVSASADSGEILVSSTVKDLVAGSGIEFADRGLHTLKGVPDEWRLYAVRS